MRFFLDTVLVDEITEANDTGLIEGVTTNPTLIRKSGGNPFDVYQAIRELGIEDISMEVSGDYDQMLAQAFELYYKFGPVATIKIPMTKEGLAVCRVLSKQGIRTNVTLIFNAAQALLAAKSGATYVSPLVARIDDQGYAGLEVVRSITQLFAVTGMKTQCLAASIRTPHRAIRSIFNGASVVTMPPSVFWKMHDHVLTDAGLAIFDEDVKHIS